MREKMCEIIHPYVETALKDRESMGEIEYTNADLHKRLTWIEGVFEEGQGKNVVFDRIMETMVNSEVDRLKFTSYVQGQINLLTEMQETVDLKLDSQSFQLKTHEEMMNNILKENSLNLES